MSGTASRGPGRRRPVGYAPWTPRGETLDALDRIRTVLEDQRDYWPITPRQILYRLMGAGHAVKADAEKIGDYLVRGRRGGLIPWDAIGDGRTESKIPIVCDDPEAFFAEMRNSASAYQLDRQEGQDLYIEVVVEAAGAVEQLYRTTSQYGVPVYSGSGFVPVTALRKVVLRAKERAVRTLILVLGDYDPAGRYIRDRVADDIEAFALDHDVEIDVETVALTVPQIDRLELIKAPMTEQKRRKYPDWPHDWTVELEAVTPADLSTIVEATIEFLTDEETRQAMIDREADERAALMKQLEEEGDA